MAYVLSAEEGAECEAVEEVARREEAVPHEELEPLLAPLKELMLDEGAGEFRNTTEFFVSRIACWNSKTTPTPMASSRATDAASLCSGAIVVAAAACLLSCSMPYRAFASIHR